MSFAANLAAADAAVAGYFDEQVFTAIAMARPIRDVNALPQADTTRPSFAFRGTIEFDAPNPTIGRSDFPAYRQGGDRQVAKVCLTALAKAWPWMPTQDDQIAMGDQRYALAADPDRDGTDRVVMWLNRVRTAA